MLLSVSGVAYASANNFIREVERLVAISEKTYTVIVNQYEQTYSYWTGKNRLIIRVLNIENNELISETLLTSVQIDQSMEEPYTRSYSQLPDEPQSIGNVLLEPQALYKNLQYPKYRFHIDENGVFINKNGRQRVLSLSDLETRFSDLGVNLLQEIDSNNIEFTGWYKVDLQGENRFFLVINTSRVYDDTGGYEYVFSIPNK